jgi:hypothetical protein
LAPSPDASFPEAMGDDSALEATYRFLRNPAVTPARVLAPHVAATVRRAVAAKRIIVAHDTTEIRFSTARDGLGRLNDQGHGFFAHFALALGGDRTKQPLGVLGLETIFRHGPVEKKKGRRRTNGEGRRWGEMVSSVRAQLGGKVEAIHVMDREADSYPLLADLVASHERFILRMRHDRTIEVPQPGCYWLADKLELAEDLFVREGVPIARRRRETASKDRGAHPPREPRTIDLAIRAVAVVLRRPSDLRAGPKTLRANVVHVHELAPPVGATAIDWKLITTEPIETIEEVASIVDSYRARWIIEEYFKALKTGCAVEKRQLENHHSILNALAIFAPIAWHLLLVRHLARNSPSKRASDFLPPLRLRLMCAHPRIKLPVAATIRDAMFAIARLGGHLKNNGDPGWQVLGRGFEKLLLLEEGAAIALGM